MNIDLPADRPPMPATPREALGELARETVIVEGRTFVLMRPTDSDSLLDVPAVRAAFAVDEYMPYWADLWPGARMLGKVLLRQPPPTGTRVLEIGCGLGLPGIVSLSLGLHVTFSDYDATALQFAAENARANGQTNFELLQMDWRWPPENLHFPLVLAADLIYEMRNVPPLVTLLKKLLEPGGTCLLTDQDRPPSHFLRETLAAEGLAYTTQLVRAGEPGGRRFKGTLYRIEAPAGARPDFEGKV
jgi:predicted nicotinamide N-methyase